MDKSSYKFKSLEDKYKGFLAPAFEITVGSKKIDTTKIAVSSLTVDIDAGQNAGGCSFTIESQYDYEKRKWDNSLLKTIQVGAKLTIKAGYVSKKEIFFGFVDDYTITYSADSAPALSVNGIDAKGYLMNAKDNKYMSEKSTAAVVKEILGECVSKGYAKKVTVGTIKDFSAELVQEDMDDYRFLCYLAQNYHMSFFVVDGEMIFSDVMDNKKPILSLKLGVSLMSFSLTTSLKNQVGKVVVYGIDPVTLKPISGEASNSSDGDSGKEAGDIARGFNNTVQKEVSYLAQTAEECKKLAQARFDEIASTFVTGRGRCVGIPELIPGRYIEVSGLDSGSNTRYFITKVTHEYTAEGYYTSFEVKGARLK